jgi:transcriptional regulator with XRE-family HTH domain
MKLQRQRLGLTQEDVARELGVDRSTVAGWETGRAYPDPRLLAPLAALLETTTDRLLKVDEEVGRQATSP